MKRCVNGAGGPDFHKAAIGELKPEALGGGTMKKVFDTYRKVLSYVDAGRPNRDWNLAAAMVIDGEGGDADHGRLGDRRVPSTGKKVADRTTSAATVRARPTCSCGSRTTGASSGPRRAGRRAQLKLAEITMDPADPGEFNILKGSIPSRLDVKPDDFSGCGLNGHGRSRRGAEVGQHGRLASQNSAQTTGGARRLRGRRQRIRQRSEHDARRRVDKIARASADSDPGRDHLPARGRVCHRRRLSVYGSRTLVPSTRTMTLLQPMTSEQAGPSRAGSRGARTSSSSCRAV